MASLSAVSTNTDTVIEIGNEAQVPITQQPVDAEPILNDLTKIFRHMSGIDIICWPKIVGYWRMPTICSQDVESA